MKLNARSLVTSLLALSILLSVQIASSADVFHRAAINGRHHLKSVYATGYNVNAWSTFYTASGKTVPGGSVMISNNLLTVRAAVSNVTVDTISIQGASYAHAMVTSTSFNYKGDSAHVVVEMTGYTKLGEVGYAVIRDKDGALLAASWPNGFYAQVPLEWGGIAIH